MTVGRSIPNKRSLVFDFHRPISLCSRKPTTMWPFVYVTSGGLRVIVTEQKESDEKDDAFVINVRKIKLLLF